MRRAGHLICNFHFSFPWKLILLTSTNTFKCVEWSKPHNLSVFKAGNAIRHSPINSPTRPVLHPNRKWTVSHHSKWSSGDLFPSNGTNFLTSYISVTNYTKHHLKHLLYFRHLALQVSSPKSRGSNLIHLSENMKTYPSFSQGNNGMIWQSSLRLKSYRIIIQVHRTFGKWNRMSLTLQIIKKELEKIMPH
jgi:hypothetical protein